MSASLAPWLEHIAELRAKRPRATFRRSPTRAAFTQRTSFTISGASPKGKAIVATDVGQHQMWEAQYYSHERPRTLITSGGLGTMGFALPAAIGARFARPDDEIWVIAGDGGFQMTACELTTIAQEAHQIEHSHCPQRISRHGPAMARDVLRRALRSDSAQ